ncbi:MAG: hypothetical protein K1Y02_03370 [Candidatus Hydrogenedentes bacterium]|nr:hypothetical protein [Candidatus Hydrogenedentota bacterium]
MTIDGKPRSAAMVLVFLWAGVLAFAADGFLPHNGARLFPIGFYELPGDDAGLADMASAGVNLVRCGTRADLDRAQAANLMGWMPLPLDGGATDELKAQIQSVLDHPALAVWEGPDEMTWNYTAYSGLHKSGVYDKKGEWWEQTPKVIAYSETKAAEIIPKFKAAVEMIRAMDTQARPIWMNEAQSTDVRLVRQYLSVVDITGCDTYPVSKEKRAVASIGGTVDRWRMTGNEMPVWMVLQAFSWHELGESYADRGVAYPSFAESRFMAYASVLHGAKGVLYWGSSYMKNQPFRTSLYALTSELASLQPFLVAPSEPSASVRLVETPEEREGKGISFAVRRAGDDWLIALLNEDDKRHMGVEVSGLEGLEGRELFLLYGDEPAPIVNGTLVVRMQPHEVKLFATSRSFESARRDGRDYAGE